VTKYFFACRQIDASWIKLQFESVNDTLAIAYALELRTSAECKLYESDRLIATFDGSLSTDAYYDQHLGSTQSEQGSGLETESAYFARKANELRMCALDAPLRFDVQSNLALAKDLDSLGEALAAHCRRKILHQFAEADAA
jgi:hypothetical protein